MGDPTNIWLLNPNEHGEGGSTSLSLEGEGVGKGVNPCRIPGTMQASIQNPFFLSRGI